MEGSISTSRSFPVQQEVATLRTRAAPFRFNVRDLRESRRQSVPVVATIETSENDRLVAGSMPAQLVAEDEDAFAAMDNRSLRSTVVRLVPTLRAMREQYLFRSRLTQNLAFLPTDLLKTYKTACKTDFKYVSRNVPLSSINSPTITYY